jgi:uncharacterized protein
MTLKDSVTGRRVKAAEGVAARWSKLQPGHPNATEVEGHKCFKDLSSIPGSVDVVVTGTRPERAQATMEECEQLGIKFVWMNRGPGGGSVSREAAEYGRELGISVIGGGCPLVFEPTSDPGHRMMRWMFTVGGNVPRHV